MKMLLRVRWVGLWQTNAYVMVCPASMQSVLIDPAGELCTLEALLEGTRPVAVLVTHFHPDHTSALEEMRSRLRVPAMAHPVLTGKVIGRALADADVIPVGEHQLKPRTTCVLPCIRTIASSSATRSLKAAHAKHRPPRIFRSLLTH